MTPTKEKWDKEKKTHRATFDTHQRKEKVGWGGRQKTKSDLDAYQSALRRDLEMRLGIYQIFRPRTPRVPRVEGPGLSVCVPCGALVVHLHLACSYPYHLVYRV